MAQGYTRYDWTENETELMTHIDHFGSDGYPIRKYGPGRWHVGRDDGTAASPIVYKTRREAVAQFEAWLQAKRDQAGQFVYRQATVTLDSPALT